MPALDLRQPDVLISGLAQQGPLPATHQTYNVIGTRRITHFERIETLRRFHGGGRKHDFQLAQINAWPHKVLRTRGILFLEIPEEIRMPQTLLDARMIKEQLHAAPI